MNLPYFMRVATMWQFLQWLGLALVRIGAPWFLAGLLVVGIGSCAAPQSGQSPEVTLTLSSFAVTRAAHDHIIPKFVEKWKQEHNQTVRFRQSYGGSAAQARAVIDGLEADVVHLALSLDVTSLERANLIDKGWEQELPEGAIVTRSVPVIITRPGNPKNIRNWSDLATDGVQFITADPKTSGVARWNFLALWNSAIKATGGTEQKALEFVRAVYTQNVPLLSRDAREATDAFYKQNQGDALVNYENELLLAQSQGEKEPYVIPDVNISIENPVAVVDAYAKKHGVTEVANAFVRYLYSPEAQREFANVGFRPVEESVVRETASKFPRVKSLSSAKDFGGWDAIQRKFFADGALFDQIRRR
ncbi:MAG: sulfate ABC transporter substrate-binding protein [Oscillatoriales cyanobacterium SM2_2_1]|nr:sulfate ABC transporter substrate-binding protein [Oscillatoriales cyanobacterium SM2_2_1]